MSLSLLSLPLPAPGPAGRLLLGEGHHGGLERPISQEAGGFLSLVSITAASPLLMLTGPVRATEPLGPTSHSAFPTPQPRLCSSKCHLSPGLALPDLASFCPSKHPHCPGVSCTSLCLSCVPTLGQLPLVWGVGSDSMD